MPEVKVKEETDPCEPTELQNSQMEESHHQQQQVCLIIRDPLEKDVQAHIQTGSSVDQGNAEPLCVKEEPEQWIKQEAMQLPVFLFTNVCVQTVDSRLLQSDQLCRETAVLSQTVVIKENSVVSLQKNPFAWRSFEEKMRVKELGPDQPDLHIQQQAADRGRTFIRGFTRSYYEKRSWIMGCDVRNAFFCFPCLLFQSPGTEALWTTTGVNDLKHLSEKCKRHETNRSHLENYMKLKFFGQASFVEQLDERYRFSVRQHNEEVTRNRRILSRIIDCVKFCGAFELALHDERDSSDNPQIFCGLVDFVSSIDGLLKEHLEKDTVIKWTSETVQNELLACMLSVTREEIIKEVRDSDFLSIQVHKTTDTSRSQLVLMLRYIDQRHNVQVRFFEFIPLQSATAESIAAALKECLAAILPQSQKEKLICQAYNGVSVMRGATAGIQRKVQEVYPNAHYVHCNALQLNSILQQATSHITAARVFFCDLEGFTNFFSRSPERTSVLYKALAHRTSTTVGLDFKSRAVHTVFEHREELINCLEKIQNSGDFDPITVREAGALARLLDDYEFTFFLDLFHRIMSHVDVLYAKLQKRDIGPGHIKESVQQFQMYMQNVRNSLYSTSVQNGGSWPAKRRRTITAKQYKSIAAEVCNTILEHTSERFSFTGHLICATLLQTDRFEEYTKAFPEEALSSTVKSFQMLSGSRLKTELSLIYSQDQFKICRGTMDIFRLFMENNLEEVFSETVKLLKTTITTPTTRDESCPSAFKRITAFLKNTTSQNRLNALAMLSVEKKLIADMTDFNQKVIEKFAQQKERRTYFMFK